MGSVNFLNIIEAANYQDGYEKLVIQAEYEYGYDPYNGTISTTSLGSITKKFSGKYTKSNEKKARKFIEDDGFGKSKRVCYVIDLGITSYNVLTVKKRNLSDKDKTPAKYITKYVICDVTGTQVNNKTYKNATEAKKDVQDLLLTGSYGSLYIEKKPILVSGSPITSCYETQVRTYKTRPKKIPHNAKLIEIHRFMYYGWAGC